MSSFSRFSSTRARPLPVILLADVSGSMEEDGKIHALNRAVREMIERFRGGQGFRAEIHLSAITFESTARKIVDLQPARMIEWQDQVTGGSTAMGAAFDLARDMIEDRSAILERAYRATILLVTDGEPNDDWQAALERLKTSSRGSKAFRLAMGIGAAANFNMLRKFHNHPTQDVLRADGAGEIAECFEYFSDSVVTRSRLPNPDSPAGYDPTDLDDLGG